jgi:hypothetical protein
MILPNRKPRVYHVTKPVPASLYTSRTTSLQKSKVEPDKGKCACGRRKKDAAVYTYRSRTDRFLFHRCECGSEWTEHRTDIDPLDPVSSDEVIEVHKRLAKFEGSIAELLESHSA